MDFEELSVFELSAGKHDEPANGLCALEAVAWLDGQPHSDRPRGVCEALRDFVVMMNDTAPSNELRQKLVPYLPRLIGTEDQRAFGKRMKLLNAAKYPVRDERLAAEFMSFPRTPTNEQWLGYFAALDQMLAIGKQGEFRIDPKPRVKTYKTMMKMLETTA